MNISDIGIKIRKIRKSLQLTQRDFAHRLMVSQSYLSGIEVGNEKPNDKFLKFLCLEYGVSEKWLYTGEGEMYEDTYDYDKDEMATLSNRALATILTSLTTASNVKYSTIASLLASIAFVIESSDEMDSTSSLSFLYKIELLCINFDRMLEALIIQYDENVQSRYEKEIRENYNDLMDFLRNKE